MSLGEETTKLLRFNAWSRKRLLEGKKRLTSRSKRYVDDEQVLYIIGPVPCEFICTYLYRDEGAESPEELHRVINGIFRRKVEGYEEFFVHVLDVPKVLAALKEG